MTESSHLEVKEYFDADASSYREKRWFRNEIARADYRMTRDALLEALRPAPGERILEVGCGPGTWTRVVSELCGELVAVDISAEMLEEARRYVPSPNVTFVNADFMRYRPRRLFDKAFMVRVFEYFENRAGALSLLHGCLKEGGVLVIISKSFPSIWNGRVRVLSVLCRLLGRPMPGGSWVEHRSLWRKRISPFRLRSLLLASGFRSVQLRPVILRPPCFGRGEWEYPLVFPPWEERLLNWSFRVAEKARSSAWLAYPGLFLSESYLARAVRKANT